VRKGKAGREGAEPGQIAWWEFHHYAARPTIGVVRQDAAGRDYTELVTVRVAGDMDVHTHVAVPNTALAESGRLGSLHLDKLDGRIKEWGAVYQAFLASNLRRHGVEVVLDARTGMARLAAVPERVCEFFSKRSTNGDQAAREYAQAAGIDWDALGPDARIKLIKQGVQNPRLAKQDDLARDWTAWQQGTAQLGYRHRSVLRPGAIIPAVPREERLEYAYTAALPILDEELQWRARLNAGDVRAAAARGLIAAGIEAAEDVDAITRAFRTRGVQQDGRETALMWGTAADAQGRERIGVTTVLHQEQERELIALATAAAADKTAVLPIARIDAAVRQCAELDFTSEHGRRQRAVMDQLGTGGRLSAAIGVAGAGKSSLLTPLVRAWKAEGRTVHGIALAWRQADDLPAAGIDRELSRSLQSFSIRVAAGRTKLNRDSVVVLDEAALIGTRQLLDLLRMQRQHEFQLVLIGDPKQCQSIEAGPVISLLRKALGEKAIPELAGSIRQTDIEERETVLLWREGRAEEAIARKRDNGTLQIVPGGYQEAIAHIVNLWASLRDANRDNPDYQVTISGPTNQAAHEIATAIRERRRVAGEMGPDRVRLDAVDQLGRQYQLPLAAGDRVRLFDWVTAPYIDTRKNGCVGRNGSVLDVVAVDDAGMVLRTAQGREARVSFTDITDARTGRVRLGYGDVLTTHTVQGATVRDHIHAMPGGSRQVNAFTAYTSGSRHRHTSYLVTSAGAEQAEIQARRPLGDTRPIRENDVLNNMVRNLSRQPDKESALEFLKSAANVRRGAARGLQEGLRPGEARASTGRCRSTLAQTFARQREERGLNRPGRDAGQRLQNMRIAAARLREALPRVADAVTEVVRQARPALRQITGRARGRRR
jgi:hypothetical protein